MDRPYLKDSHFLELLDRQQTREQSVKIVLLDFDENEIGEIHGIATSGSVNVSGSSPLRRTCSLTLVADKNYNSIANFEDVLSLNKKIRVEGGYTNNVLGYEHYPDVIWFPLGTYVIVDLGINSNAQTANITINGHDKMCLLNGTVAGQIPAAMALHEKVTIAKGENGENDLWVSEPVTMFEIVQELVHQMGGEAQERVIVNDLPQLVKKAVIYQGSETIYFDIDGNQVSSSATGTRPLEPGQPAGYDLVPFTFPSGELIAQPGETIAGVLEKIRQVLGNYEFFYDIDGNFIFQEIKNYLNTSFIPIEELPDKNDYTVSFKEGPVVYDLTGDPTITSYSNTPNMQNIKNDFIVWGERDIGDNRSIPIRYHLVIDDLPTETNGLPWQVYLYNLGKEQEQAGMGSQLNFVNYYYRELKHEIPKLYWLPGDPDNTENKTGWKEIDGTNMDFFVDMIDSRTELGRFSVNTIGRRTLAIKDDSVTSVYPINVPDFVIIEKGDPNGLITELNKRNQRFMIIEQRNLYRYSNIGRSAFDVARELLHQHTVYSESIRVNCLPKMYLEPNSMIKVYDEKTGIDGHFILTDFDIPLDAGGQSSLTAVAALSRI